MESTWIADKLTMHTYTLGILSGKGGVGKTFITTTLALAGAKIGKRIGLLDADISFPNVFKMLGITAKLTPTADKKIVPIEKWGIKLVSMAGLTASEDEPIMWRGPILSKIIQQLLKESLWGELDVLFIDFPTGTSDAAVTILQHGAVNGIVLVTTPQELALHDTRKTLNMAQVLNVPVIGVIENMRGDIFGEGAPGRFAEMHNIPFLGSIPMRKQIAMLCDNGQPPIFSMPELEMIFSKITRAIFEKAVVQ